MAKSKPAAQPVTDKVVRLRRRAESGFALKADWKPAGYTPPTVAQKLSLTQERRPERRLALQSVSIGPY